jgi:WhiB family transcriptional regulator, redox-sensing transcriptional regulator
MAGHLSGPELLRMTTKQDEWVGEAACAGTDTELFFIEPYDRGEAVKRRRRQAATLCNGSSWPGGSTPPCPVRRQCLEWALEAGYPGYWGGTTKTERDAIRRDRAASARQGVTA